MRSVVFPSRVEPSPGDDAHAILAEALDQGYCVVEVLLDERGEPRDYRFAYVNSLFQEFTGIPCDAALSGKTARELVPGLEEHWVQAYGRVALTGEPVQFEAGSEAMGRWFTVRAFRFGGSESRNVGILFADVTTQRRHEASQALLAGIADDSSRFSSEADLVRTCGARVATHLNLSACGLYRVDEQENEISPLGGWASEGLNGVFQSFAVSDFHRDEFRRAMRAGETVVIRDTEKDPRVDAGAHADINVGSFVAVPLQRDGEWRMVLAAVDVRRREWRPDEIELLEAVAARVFPHLEGARAEAALRASEARYRALATASSDVVYGVSADWSVMLPIDGRGLVASTEKPIRGWFEMNIPPPERKRVRAAIDEAIASRSPFDLEHLVSRPDGSIGWTRSRAIPILDESGNLVEWFGAASDITDRKRAEESLRESEERFRDMADHAPMMVWVTEPDGTCSYLSQSWYEFTGQTPETGLGFGWIQATHPDDQALAERAFAEANANHFPFWVEYRVRRADGEYRWAIDSAKPRMSASGEFLGYIGSVIDITERKAVEEALQKLNEELEIKVLDRTAQLAEAVKEAEGFNYSVAHDLRAPVRAVSSTSRILLDEVGQELEPEYREMLERQALNATRLGTLIDELLRLSRLARAEVNCEDLDMTEAARSVAREIDPPCRVEVQEGMRAEGDHGLVRTVLHNLIGNACKFSPEGGTVRVGQEGDVFSVRDEGIGFEMKYAPRMFLPFERLVSEDQFEGTGIGLANVERIVRRHGGRVWAESDGLGKGATFYFTLGPS